MIGRISLCVQVFNNLATPAYWAVSPNVPVSPIAGGYGYLQSIAMTTSGVFIIAVDTNTEDSLMIRPLTDRDAVQALHPGMLQLWMM